jgi:peptide/nickel transport system permease protein
MFKYIVKRLLYFIPTLIAISIITFIISVNAPGDPVESMLNKSSGEGQLSENLAYEASYSELRHRLNLDLPLFYFSINSASSCDTLFKINNMSHRAVLERMAFTYGDWKDVSRYYLSIKNLEASLALIPKTDMNEIQNLAYTKNLVNNLYLEYDITVVLPIINNIYSSIEKNDFMKPSLSQYVELKSSYESLLKNKQCYMRYVPVIHWYGLNNQYHLWLKDFLQGDFGISYQDRRPVSSVIWSALGWTTSISLLSVLIAYLIAIPIGVISAADKGSIKEKSITSVLFMLYSLPNFWVATLAVIFLCGGDWLSWFPSPGADWPDTNTPIGEWFPAMVYHLILPLICWTYGSLAFISRQMRGGILNALGQEYIRTARAKGLNRSQVLWKHAYRNSLLPIITLFASVFPMAISGAFVIEYIFSIPGMGKLSLEALLSRNYPVIYAVMMFTAILTLVGNLFADILYALADPRISFSQNKS